MTEPTAIFIKSEDDFQRLKTQVVEEFHKCWEDLLSEVYTENYPGFKKVADDAFNKFKGYRARMALFSTLTISFEQEEDSFRIANDYVRQYMEDQNDE